MSYLEDMFPDVEPAMGRVLCYHVKSRKSEDTYWVDWVEGYCTCPDYHKTHKLRESKNGEPYVCFHMTRAMKYGWEVQRDIAKEMTSFQAPLHHD